MASSHPLVERFRAPDVPRPLKAAAARGALPLPAEDLLEILFLLRREQDRDLQRDIVATIEAMPPEVLRGAASSPGTPPAMLDFLARACIRRDPVLEALLKNPATADATLALMAQHGSESILEFLSFNQVRLTRAPAIIQAMLQSPRCSASIRRRLQEIWELHQNEQAARARVTTEAPAALAEPSLAEAAAAAEPEPEGEPAAVEAQAPTEQAPPNDDEAAADALAAELAAQAEATSLDDLANLELNAKILEEMSKEDDVSEEELRLAQKLLTMTVPDKIQLALKGDRNARMVLIRDAAKLVQEAVIHSPKITDNEIEQISKMRSISVDVIRALVGKREAMKSYVVVSNLVRNPKTPVPDAMTLMQRLQDRDLVHITKDKNVADMVRRQAAIVLQKRQPKQVKKKGGH